VLVTPDFALLCGIRLSSLHNWNRSVERLVLVHGSVTNGALTWRGPAAARRTLRARDPRRQGARLTRTRCTRRQGHGRKEGQVTSCTWPLSARFRHTGVTSSEAHSGRVRRGASCRTAIFEAGREARRSLRPHGRDLPAHARSRRANGHPAAELRANAAPPARRSPARRGSPENARADPPPRLQHAPRRRGRPRASPARGVTSMKRQVASCNLARIASTGGARLKRERSRAGLTAYVQLRRFSPGVNEASPTKGKGSNE
jgi:hypothetical protein